MNQVPPLAAAVLIAAWLTQPALAINTAPSKPKPQVDCSKKANKSKPACQTGMRPDAGEPSASTLSDDELYNAAYWLARQGDYASSLTLLRRVRNSDVPKILNATGFATRKLGDVAGALPYYTRALTLDPNYTRAREYLGEAHLSQGDVEAAKAQLLVIETRCGKSCSGYPELASQIADFEKSDSKTDG